MITKKLLSYLKSQLFLLGALLVFVTTHNNAYATIRNVTSTTFSCDNIYLGSDDGVYVWSGSGGAFTRMYQQSSPNASTIALGWSTGRGQAGSVLTMYGWPYGAGATVSKLVSGATSDTTMSTGLTSEWAGGEVNQLTGEIYMGSFYASYIGASAGLYRFKLAIYNPNTGVLKQSTGLTPATTSDALASGSDYVASDMAIDAEGNAYIISGPANGTGTKYLLRVTPGTDGTYWTYNIVANLGALPSPTTIWGMAFFNGSLYFATSGNQLYQVSVLTGASTNVTVTGVTGLPTDLAACQVAPVIKGNIYYDEDGTGNITSSTSTLSGISVELWKDNTLVKTFVTNDSGEYSFIVDSINSQNYYIALNQPKINSIDAV